MVAGEIAGFAAVGMWGIGHHGSPQNGTSLNGVKINVGGRPRPGDVPQASDLRFAD